MQTATKRVKLITEQSKSGKTYLACPFCRVNKQVLQIRPDTEARRLICHCRKCKAEFMIDISQGQCYLSQCQ